MPIKLKPSCIICKKATIPIDDEIKTCSLCGEKFEAFFTCESNHFVCPLCKQKAARQDIIDHCLKNDHTQPYPIIIELMSLPSVSMHGPEHHLLLTAALLTAYTNEKGIKSELPAFLEEANNRSLNVPGGACGAWGVCGAAIGSGIYMSIITQATPFKAKEWKTTGQLTARCADAISKEGGPRCCKRDTFLSLAEAIGTSNRELGTSFSTPDHLICDFYQNNRECKGLSCPFFPKNPHPQTV